MKGVVPFAARVCFAALLALTALPALPARGEDEPPPLPPTLVAVSPDRVAPGGTITLTGTDFGSDPSLVTVTFTGATATAASASGTSLTVVVPAGARTGPLFVTVVSNLSDGSTLTQQSDTLGLLVIWKIFPVWQVFQLGSGRVVNVLQPCGFDHICDALSKGVFTNPPFEIDDLEEIRADSTTRRVLRRTDISSGGLFQGLARNPLTDHVLGFHRPADLHLFQLKDFTTDAVLFTNPFENDPVAWIAYKAAFDRNGNLVLLAAANGGLLGGIFRFGPCDTIVLDPNGPNSLIPGGAPLNPSTRSTPWLDEMVVAADGTIYAVDGQAFPGPPNLWRVPARDGSAYEKIPLPPTQGLYAGYGFWWLATDCDGNAYGLNPYTDDPNGSGALTIYRLLDKTPVAHLTDVVGFFGVDGFSSDDASNFFIQAYAQGDPTHVPIIRRVLPSELPAGFYDALPCSKVPVDVDGSGVVPTAPGPAAARSTQKRTAAPLRSQQLCTAQNLRLEVSNKKDGVFIRSFADGADLTVPLGAILTFRAKDNGLDAIGLWALSNSIRLNPIPEDDDLFRADVGILFDKGAPAVNANSRDFTGLHQGSTTLTFSLPGPVSQSKVRLRIKVTVDAPVGGPPATYDALIMAAADAFGVWPQIMKGLVEQETAGTFNPRAYRYEPITWDWSIFSDRLYDPPYYPPFRVQEPPIPGLYSAPVPVGSLTSEWVPERLNTLVSLKRLTFGVCFNLSGTSPVSVWELILGSDGFDFPNVCGVRHNWTDMSNQTVKANALMFFRTHPEYNAQTVLSASYGLTQLGFNALRWMEWMSNDTPLRRVPDNLDNPAINLKLGAHWLAAQSIIHDKLVAPTKTVRATPENLEGYFQKLLIRYNGTKPYGGEVVAKSKDYVPIYK